MGGRQARPAPDHRAQRPPLSYFLDTNVFLYARGADHPHRDPARRVLDAVMSGRLEATTSVEVVQELVHVYGRDPARRPAGLAFAREILDAFEPVLSIEARDMRSAIELWQGTPEIDARDALHAAICLRHGLQLVSTDRAFDRIPHFVRQDPGQVAIEPHER